MKKEKVEEQPQSKEKTLSEFNEKRYEIRETVNEIINKLKEKYPEKDSEKRDFTRTNTMHAIKEILGRAIEKNQEDAKEFQKQASSELMAETATGKYQSLYTARERKIAQEAMTELANSSFFKEKE